MNEVTKEDWSTANKGACSYICGLQTTARRQSDTEGGPFKGPPPDLKDPLFSSKFYTLIIKSNPQNGGFWWIRIVSTAILEDF